jgi:hypothetical protein
MTQSELQHRNLIVTFCLEDSNDSRCWTVEYFKLLEYKKPTIYRTIKRLEKQENVDNMCHFIVQSSCCLKETNRRSRIVIWGGRSKFITTLKGIWQRRESTAKPKNPHLKPKHVNNPSSNLGWIIIKVVYWPFLTYWSAES